LGPQSGESLAHRLDRILYNSRSDLPFAGANLPVAVALGDELEDGKRIGAATEEFIGTEGKTEALPDAPSRVGGGGGATRIDSGFDGFADKAKVRAEFIVALR
jgi:hypothetical protein